MKKLLQIAATVVVGVGLTLSSVGCDSSSGGKDKMGGNKMTGNRMADKMSDNKMDGNKMSDGKTDGKMDDKK
jgi:hypothetical protein